MINSTGKIAIIMRGIAVRKQQASRVTAEAAGGAVGLALIEDLLGTPAVSGADWTQDARRGGVTQLRITPGGSPAVQAAR